MKEDTWFYHLHVPEVQNSYSEGPKTVNLSKILWKTTEDPVKSHFSFYGYRSPYPILRTQKTARFYLLQFQSYKVNFDGAFYFEMDSSLQKIEF